MSACRNRRHTILKTKKWGIQGDTAKCIRGGWRIRNIDDRASELRAVLEVGFDTGSLGEISGILSRYSDTLRPFVSIDGFRRLSEARFERGDRVPAEHDMATAKKCAIDHFQRSDGDAEDYDRSTLDDSDRFLTHERSLIRLPERQAGMGQADDALQTICLIKFEDYKINSFCAVARGQSKTGDRDAARMSLAKALPIAIARNDVLKWIELGRTHKLIGDDHEARRIWSLGGQSVLSKLGKEIGSPSQERVVDELCEIAEGQLDSGSLGHSTQTLTLASEKTIALPKKENFARCSKLAELWTRAGDQNSARL